MSTVTSNKMSSLRNNASREQTDVTIHQISAVAGASFDLTAASGFCRLPVGVSDVDRANGKLEHRGNVSLLHRLTALLFYPHLIAIGHRSN